MQYRTWENSVHREVVYIEVPENTTLVYSSNLIGPIHNVPLALTNTWAIFGQELAMTENTGQLKDRKYQPRGNQQGKKEIKIRTSSVLCIRQSGMINFLYQALKFESLKMKTPILLSQVAEQEQVRAVVSLWTQQLIPLLFCIGLTAAGERTLMKCLETGAWVVVQQLLVSVSKN